MMVLTISTFVDFQAVNANPLQATGPMLVTRCLVGWSYGMVQILFVSIGKQGYMEAMDDLHAQIQNRAAPYLGISHSDNLVFSTVYLILCRVIGYP